MRPRQRENHGQYSWDNRRHERNGEQFDTRATERRERHGGQQRYSRQQRLLTQGTNAKGLPKGSPFDSRETSVYFTGVASACLCGAMVPPQASRGRFCATPVLPMRIAV